MWEGSLLARVGRVNLRRTVRAFFEDLFSNPAYQPLDLTPEDVFLADELRFNRDPFDALIVASARNARLPLITRDGDIRKAGLVAVIWQASRSTPSRRNCASRSTPSSPTRNRARRPPEPPAAESILPKRAVR